MGCDIHCYIEYKNKDRDSWGHFGGRINPGRHYRIFGRIAGVRASGEFTQVAPLRGFPADAGPESSSDNHLYISEVEAECCCTLADAEKWVAQGTSKWEDNKLFVSHPDWHSHTWLSADEFEKAIQDLGNEKYRAALAAMRSFEADGLDARIVIWFDN